MAPGLDDLRRKIRSLASLASSIQINGRQCELLARKAAEIVPVLDEFEDILRQRELNSTKASREHPPDWTAAATELHGALTATEALLRDCCCGDGQWLQVEILRGKLTQTFAKLLYDLEWHTWVLCSIPSVEMSGVLPNRANCDGALRFNDLLTLSAAAKQDRASLRALLTNGTHVCDEKVCQPDVGEQCLAAKLLEKLDAENLQELMDEKIRNKLTSEDVVPSRFLWVKPECFPKNGRKIGKGGYAKVRETEWLGQKLALKIFKLGTAYNMTFKQEVAAVAGLDHPNVVRVVCCSEGSNQLAIVLELMYKSLFDLIHQDCSSSRPGPPFSIAQAVDLMLQIAEGVRYLHGKDLVHRDLKSGNVLVQFADAQTASRASLPDSGTVKITENTCIVAKIADFGMTKTKNESTYRNNQTINTGTTKWMAPEVRGSDPEDSEARFHPRKLDVYSFGIICYEILSGEQPFSDVYLQGSLRNLVRAGKRPNLPEGIPARLAVLIQECWTGNPLLRPDFPSICTELRFIKKLLLQDYNFANDITLSRNLKLDSVMVQGPWGGKGGQQFCDGTVTSIKQIKLHYDTGATNIWYMEIEYDINGTSFLVGHGEKKHGTASGVVKIDGLTEYITQIEGYYGTSVYLPSLTVVQSLTIHTNKGTYGPFGREKETGADETKFKSDSGRIVGFFGKCTKWLDQIGCFIAPVTPTTS